MQILEHQKLWDLCLVEPEELGEGEDGEDKPVTLLSMYRRQDEDEEEEEPKSKTKPVPEASSLFLFSSTNK